MFISTCFCEFENKADVGIRIFIRLKQRVRVNILIVFESQEFEIKSCCRKMGSLHNRLAQAIVVGLLVSFSNLTHFRQYRLLKGLRSKSGFPSRISNICMIHFLSLQLLNHSFIGFPHPTIKPHHFFLNCFLRLPIHIPCKITFLLCL